MFSIGSHRVLVLLSLQIPPLNEIMRNRRLILPLLLLVLAPRLSHAQPPTLSPERRAAMLEAGRLMNDPVEFVLQYRKELALTGAQVASIEKLAGALRDSTAARTMLLMRQSQTNTTLPGLVSVMEWSGSIDEGAIRDAVRQQSAVQAEVMIASARDRRMVGALLTPEQRMQLPKLQMAEMMKAARGGSR